MSKHKRKPVQCPVCNGLKDPRATSCLPCRDAMVYEDSANAQPRTCTKCDRHLPAEEFRLRRVTDRKGGGFRRESTCLDCYRAEARRRIRARVESGAAPWTNPVYVLRHNARKVWHVDPSSLVAFVQAHDGRCEICGRTSEEVHPGKRLAVDHSPAGVRGMLCQHCNTGLGLFRDNPHALLRAIEYIRQEPAVRTTAFVEPIE